ncbi:MAG: hypothetical protein HGB08_01935 [Candidatus Moranbacteria bacterium]|nr:hypothetical protein [Candidatus Moranbacteria bacterium]
MKEKIKEFFKQYEHKIVLVVGLLLVGAVSFEAGYLKAGNAKSSPIVIEKTPESPKNDPGSVLGCETAKTPDTGNKAAETLQNSAGSASPVKTGCAYVGSKSSDKYYPPTCQWAKRIKPENLVCFSSEQEAIGQGRVAGKGCK